MNEDLYIGPTALEPGARVSGDRIARVLFVPLLVALLVLLLVFYVVFAITKVDGDSMAPTLSNGDRLLLTRSYDEPHRGDVIAFNVLNVRDVEVGLIKRVVAVSGDRIEIRNGVAMVNGVTEDVSAIITSPEDQTSAPERVVPPGYIYVLGDNRPVALDSRDLGAIPLGSVRGRVAFVFAPITRMGRVR